LDVVATHARFAFSSHHDNQEHYHHGHHHVTNCYCASAVAYVADTPVDGTLVLMRLMMQAVVMHSKTFSEAT
jgi:hypothetical protein